MPWERYLGGEDPEATEEGSSEAQRNDGLVHGEASFLPREGGSSGISEPYRLTKAPGELPLPTWEQRTRAERQVNRRFEEESVHDSGDEVDRHSEAGPVRRPEGESWLGTLKWEFLGLLFRERRVAKLSKAERKLLFSRVSHFELRKGTLEATVHDPPKRPQRIQLRFTTFSPAEWARVARALASRRDLLERAARGELDPELCVLAMAEGLDLLPRRLADVRYACTCGSRANRCEHFIALWLVFAQHLGSHPTAMLVLRGAKAEELVSQVERAAAQGREGSLLRNEAAGAQEADSRPAASDPFAAPEAPPADWRLLHAAPEAPAPMPAPAFWRRPAEFGRLSQRLIHSAKLKAEALLERRGLHRPFSPGLRSPGKQ